MAHLWIQNEFNVFTSNFNDALDGQQANTSTAVVSDVRCNYCDLSVSWDHPSYSNKVCDIRVFPQFHNCQGRQREFGICNPLTIALASDSEMTSALADIKNLGITWVRTDFAWSAIQPVSASSYNWANYDRFVAAVNAADLHLLPILGYTPSWANGGFSDSAYAPSDPQQFATFCATVASRYASQGVLHYEIWNEPNTLFWKPKPDAIAYTELLSLAYAAIKSVQSTCQVVLGGLAQETDDGTNISPLTFLQTLYAHGGGQCMDITAFHPYTYPTGPNTSSWRTMSISSPSLRSLMHANGDGWKELWMTEYGAPTNGGSGQTFVGESVQASMLAQAIDEMRKLSWSGPLFFYTYKDGAPAPDRERYFGLLRNDGSQKPAYTALQAAIAAQVTN